MFDEVLSVTIGGIRFEGDPTMLAGFVIEPEGLSGWDESPTGRDPGSGDRPNAHGRFGANLLRASRAITLSGFILASNPSELEMMKARLTGLLADGERGRFEVERTTGTLWAYVRVISARAVDLDGRTASFVVQMEAGDPRRYGRLEVFGPGTTVQVYHRGNTNSIPTLVVTGSLPTGYKVTGPGGREFHVTQALTTGQVHEIRMRNGWLYKDAVLQFGAVSRGQVWTIPPGPSRTSMTLVPNSGSGQLQVRVRETFM